MYFHTVDNNSQKRKTVSVFEKLILVIKLLLVIVCYCSIFLEFIPGFVIDITCQSELPRPIPRNSVESEHGRTSRLYFDNAGANVTLTLHNVTLTSQKPC